MSCIFIVAELRSEVHPAAHLAQLPCRSSSVPSVSALLDSAVEGALFGLSAEPEQAIPAGSPQACAGCLSSSSDRGQEVEAAEASAEHTPPDQARPALSNQVSQTFSDVRPPFLRRLPSSSLPVRTLLPAQTPPVLDTAPTPVHQQLVQLSQQSQNTPCCTVSPSCAITSQAVNS